MNDQEREIWVLNDEGLHRVQKRSRLSMHRWVRENRAMIDEIINKVSSGEKQAHYLVYG